MTSRIRSLIGFFTLWLCAGLILAASQAHGQTSVQYVGTWLVGEGTDWAKVLRLRVRTDNNVKWGTAMGTGYDCALEVREAYGSTLYAVVTGAWEDSTHAACLFALGQASCLIPAVGTKYKEYDAILVLSKPGSRANLAADSNRKPFRFRIERFP